MHAKNSFRAVALFMSACCGMAEANANLKGLTLVSDSGGTIEASPQASLYPVGTRIKLTPIPKARYNFKGWVKGATAISAQDSLVMDSSRVVSALFVHDDEMAPNGGFDFGLSGWSYWMDASLKGSIVATNGVATISPKILSPNYSYVQMWYWQSSIAAKTTYLANFSIKASSIRTMRVGLRNNTSPWATLAPFQVLAIDTIVSHKTLTFTTTASSTSARFAFDMGLDSATIWLDSVSLRPQTFAGRAMQTAGILSLRTMRKALMLTTDEPAKWVLRTPDGKLVRSGSFQNPGEQTIWNVPEGVGIFTLQSATKVEAVRISVF